MKAPEFNPDKLDVQAFAKEGASLAGTWPLASLERLASSTAGPAEGDVHWTALGELRPVRGGEPQLWLHLTADTTLKLECQRCLGPVETGVQAKRSFLFVRGEQSAEALDADLEDDVLALPRALDLRELIEDELLLELPLVPRHEVCPEPLVAPSSPQDEALQDNPNPFAALAVLKKKGGPPN